MATVNFHLSGKGDKKNIYVRVISGREVDIRASIGLKIEPKFWSLTKGMPSQKAASTEKLNITTDLRELKNKIQDEIVEAVVNQKQINSIWLKNIIDEHRGKAIASTSNYLMDQITHYQNSLKHRVKGGKIGVSPGTIRNFNTTKNRLKEFQKFKKHKYLLPEIDLTFHSEYVDFAEKRLSLSPNSIGKDIKQIKTVVLDARDRGFKISAQATSKKFSASNEKAPFVTLNEAEIKSINTFIGADYLENARDWLVIGCWTGCRIGDLMNLTNQNIHTNVEGRKFIRYTQRKTGKTVDVLVHPDVFEILSARGGFPRKISDQRFNDYIKIVCNEVGITYEVEGAKFDKETKRKKKGIYPKFELITSHVCRRSFATNHYKKLPNKLIMAVTGHTTEAMLLNYIGEVSNDHLEDFAALWNEENKTQDVQLKQNLSTN